MATIKQVAKAAGVSVGTVSNVLSGSVPVSAELKTRVWAVIRKLDYHPNHVARSLKTKQTRMLGMVIPDFTNPFFPQVVRGAEEVVLKHGYLLVTFNTDDDVKREREVLAILRSRHIDGVLLVVAPNDGDGSHITTAVSAGVRIVCLDRAPAGVTDLDSVFVDNHEGAMLAVRHLIRQGHRRIGMIAGSMLLQTAVERLAGYKAALREAGLKVDQDLVRTGNFRINSGYKCAKDLLLAHRRPSAIFASNGQMALGALKAMEEIRLHCPDDVALVSFDDLPESDLFRPHLTAVAQPAWEIGRQGAELLIQRVEGQLTSETPVVVRLKPELKIRESTSKRVSEGVSRRLTRAL
ncbi:MAG TPA: LacI family DNA-binding transcriptional regulator [Bryobacteraceae bacterium]|nr:LacI family DNA-binding transcriptional regulator [Bryobacteraceae bacterium]